MSAHNITPIREDEVESTTSAIADTPFIKEEVHVNINMAAKTATPVGEEEGKTSSSASTMVPIREEEELDGEMMVIGYFFQVPSVKWHPKLEMMSKAGLTQGQYEQKVLAQEYVDYFACPLCTPSLHIITTSRRAHDAHATSTSTISLFCSLTRSTWSSLFVHIKTSLIHFLSSVSLPVQR